MPIASQETHFYDGKLKDIVATIIKKFSMDINFSDSVAEIKAYANTIKYERINDLNNMLNLFSRDPRGNYDPTNNSRVEDLLPRAWKLVKDRDNNNCCLTQKDQELIKNMAINDKLSDTEKDILLSLASCTKVIDEYMEALLFMANNNLVSAKDRKILFNLVNSERIGFLEQVSDVVNGTCAQGRCTRIIQVFNL